MQLNHSAGALKGDAADGELVNGVSPQRRRGYPERQGVVQADRGWRAKVWHESNSLSMDARLVIGVLHCFGRGDVR